METQHGSGFAHLSVQAGLLLFLPLALLLVPAAGAVAQGVYYPEPGQWERRSPEEVGMDAQRLQEAVDFAADPAHEGAPRDLQPYLLLNFSANEPVGEQTGPIKAHGPPTGVIVRNGYIVGEWGDPDRVDMTFSVTKSFVSTTVGLAYDRGLIRDVDDPVHTYLAPVTALVRSGGQGLGTFETFDLFGSEHNQKITWQHMLRQTNEWEGSLFGRPTWSDRFEGEIRELREPGTFYEYNDVRVNVLSLASLNVWRRPLPDVLKEYVMDPIGASDTWRWHGYENSWVLIDGQLMQSVSGGGHWGGGMWINAYDQARFGYMFLRNGRWNGAQLLSEEWIDMATTPGEISRGGFMNYSLNTGRRSVPAAPETAFWHSGHGVNRIYVDRENDIVIAVRWLDGQYFDEFIERVLGSIDGRVAEAQP